MALGTAVKVSALAASAIGVIAGGHFATKVMGSDPDFNAALRWNLMTGQGGLMKTYFSDGLRSMFMGGYRSTAAMYGGFGPGLYGNPYMMGRNPYMMNPMMMGSMPYGMGFGSMMWGRGWV